MVRVIAWFVEVQVTSTGTVQSVRIIIALRTNSQDEMAKGESTMRRRRTERYMISGAN